FRVQGGEIWPGMRPGTGNVGGTKLCGIRREEKIMAKQIELFGVQYKEGSLDPKAAELIKFAVNLAIGHEHGAKLHLGRARECGASEDEVWETVAYAMRPVAAQVRNLAKEIVAR